MRVQCTLKRFTFQGTRKSSNVFIQTPSEVVELVFGLANGLEHRMSLALGGFQGQAPRLANC